MKRIIFTPLLLIIPFCKAADYPGAMELLANGMKDLIETGFFEDVAHRRAQYISCYSAIDIARLRGSNGLDLSNKEVHTIPDNLNLPQLWYLYLQNNQIAVIGNLNLPNLQSLDLHNNQIQAIDNLNLPHLEWLDLHNNQIAVIPDNLNLPNLQRLYLVNNQIQAFSGNLDLPNLRELHLENNQIQAIGGNLNLPHLRWLYLQNNQIRYIDPNVLDQFPNLLDLYLSQNYLEQENIDQLKVYAAERNLTIVFGEQKPIHSIKAAKS